jgi:tetratricopeptide (TPR) repeat protein
MPLSSDSSTPDFPNRDPNKATKLAVECCQRGSKLLEAKEYAEAQSVYKMAIEWNPQLAIAHSGLAQANYNLGDYSAALIAIDLAIDCN